MARQLVGIGSSANDGTGDTLRDGIDKVNDNFIEIYGKIGDGTTIGTFTTTGITSTGDFTIDGSADIILDADGGDVFFKDGGTTFGSATNTSGNLIIKSGTTTALTFSGANVTAAGVVTGTTVEATGDTSSGDNAAIGYTSAEGLILTGQGSTNDITIKNDADTAVVSIPTGGTDITVAGVVTATGFTIGSAAITETELEIIDGATVTTTELNLLDGNTSVGGSITVGDSDGFIVNDGGTMKTIPASDIKTYAAGNLAADDIGTGDAAVTITTSSGNITIDAAANDSDIIFKGTDATADITMLTLDGSEAGAAIFNSTITGTALTIDDVVIDGKVMTMTGSSSDTAVFTAGTNGTLSIVTTDAAAAAANIQITADGTAELAGTTVTLDSEGDIVLDANGADIFFKDDGTTFGSATNSSGNLIVKSGTTTALTFAGANVTAAGTIGSGAITSTGVVTGTGFTIGSAAINEAELEIIDGATVTTTELNLLDGNTSVGGSITLADADGLIVNDAGTMKTIPASDLKTYAGGGKILQVVQQNVTTNFSQAQTSGAGNWTTLNNFSQAITPTASNSTILVMVNLSCVSGSNNGIAFKSIRDGSTDIQDPADSSNRKGANARTMKNSDNNHNFATVNWSVLDSPATTDETTYTIQFLCESNGTVYINRTVSLTDTAEAYGAITNSTMWLLEIGA